MSFPALRAFCAVGTLALVAATVAAGSAASASHAKTSLPLDGLTVAVANLNDAGPGSLRAALSIVNKRNAPAAVITFSVDGGTIRLASDLPAISARVKIDGTSATTYQGSPVVEINARRHAGLVFAPGSAGSKLFGIAITNAGGNGVTLNDGSITLNLNYIGLSLAGARLGNGGDGVYVSAASSNDRIGWNKSGASGAFANVISGNVGNGLSLHGSSGNVIAANRIGTSATGKRAIPNGENGIWITAGSNNNEIGGKRFVDSATGEENNPTGSEGKATPVFVVPPDGNLVSGNGQNGILIDGGSQGNVLNGNFVGTTADGDAAIPNSGDGVRIVSAPKIR